MSDCCSVQDQILILACSGGSNVGQLTNQAAIELERGGVGRLRCAVGVAAGVPGLVDGAGKAPHLIVLDGCPMACAKQGLQQQTGREPDTYVVVTDLGVEKAHDFQLEAADLAKTVAATRAALGLPADTCACTGSAS